MVRVRPRHVWHLRRGQKLYGRISDGELRLLAELGHLKSNDLLWRSGFGGWKSAESVPGVLAPPPLSPVQASTAQSRTTKINALFSAAWQEVTRWQDELTKHPRWSKFHLGDRLMQRRGAFVGLLMAVVFVGSIDVAIRAFATGAETSGKAVSLETQGHQIAAATSETAKAVQSSSPLPNGPTTAQSPSEPKPESDLTEAGGFSVSNTHPTDGSTSKPSPASLSPSEASAEPASVANPTSVSQPDSATQPDEPDAAAQPDQSDAMPLPTRKPEGLIAKEASRSKATLKRIAQRRGEREPKPMRFGNIGYNYNAQ